MEGALSAIESVRLLAGAVTDGHTALGYAGTVVSEQEDALDGLGSTFGSIQPPGGRAADDLRAEVGDLLDDATAAVADLRVAVRRGASPDRSTTGALDAAAEALRAFVEDHP